MMEHWIRTSAIALSLAMASGAQAMQLQLNRDVALRGLQESHLFETSVLRSGSVVEIPNAYMTMNESGQIDAELSLNAWLRDVGYGQNEIGGTNNDFYFPVVVIRAVGPGAEALRGQTQYLPLRRAARTQGALTALTRSSTIADGFGSSLFPLQSETPAILAPTVRTARWEIQPDSESAPATTSRRRSTRSAPRTESEAGGPCLNCTEQNGGRPTAQADDLGESADAISDAADEGYDGEVISGHFPGLTQGRRGFDALCSRFIRRDGSYGDIGRVVLREIAQDPIYMSSQNGVSRMCPRFNSFSDAQKRNFWVWAFAALAAQESSCRPRINASPRINPNGVASGLFQIEHRADLRRGRDRLYGGRYCSGGDPNDIQLNTRCAVRMLSTPLRAGAGPYSRRNQYWSSFLRAGKARRLIAQYSACRGGSR